MGRSLETLMSRFECRDRRDHVRTGGVRIRCQVLRSRPQMPSGMNTMIRITPSP